MHIHTHTHVLKPIMGIVMRIRDMYRQIVDYIKRMKQRKREMKKKVKQIEKSGEKGIRSDVYLTLTVLPFHLYVRVSVFVSKSI